MPDLRPPIAQSLATLADAPLRESARGLLKTLGYTSDRTHDLGNSDPRAFLDFVQEHASDSTFSEEKALVDQWTSADLLFQLTDEELAGRRSLFEETDIGPGLLRSYLFFAIDLADGNYSRGRLTAIARQINRVFPMPVMVLLRHRSGGERVLSITVINRRQNKREADKDVLGKVAIIRDINLTDPHRGHLDILNSLALSNLEHPQRLPITSFDALHTAWEQIFNVELLNERFYRELSNWYFWALPQVRFPADTPAAQEDDEKHRATALIRLLTRIIFCWFIKEKDLVPEALFNEADLKGVLTDLDPEASTYYQAILQNLFFATLNTQMGKDRDGQPHRAFALDEGFQKNRDTHGVPTLFRYENHFQDTEAALDLFAGVPFLNGGLFESLDRTDHDTGKRLYVDGFTRNPAKRPHVPNKLFFAPRQKGIDLSDAYGEQKRRNETVRGLLHILHGYKFTIVENTPIDQEIALDPELLGKVFENLLASYNEETKTTARKQTGSFYTPRSIVEYMVDEALKAHLAKALIAAGMTEEDADDGLGILFAYTEKDHPFVEAEVGALLDAIHASKILDPACGSGAFPMGVLQKLVYIIHKLDPDNEKWKRLQIERASDIPDPSARDAAITAIERDFEENEDDYGRKLYLIENCLYGVDIQPIAIQISKLRFFISLVADQRTNRDKSKNRGVRPLPNLETKFVAADTLAALPEAEYQPALVNPRVDVIERHLERAYHDHFTARTRREKRRIQRKVRELREELARLLAESLGSQKKAEHVAAWNPFDPQTSADFFDPHWMFGRSLADGFDVILGNPPYISVEKFAGSEQQKAWKAAFDTYAGRGDVYCFFYERGIELLKPGGVLVYITSNKWMRAGYGKSLRSLLASEVNTEAVLDFGMGLNFNAAAALTEITLLKRRQPDGEVLACYATDDRAAMADPAGYFEDNKVTLTGLSDEPWVVLSKDRQRVKELVEAQGTPLQDWDIQFNYGIKTGYNDAFYLTQAERDGLVAEDPASADLIGPLLRGRDIGRYEVEWDGIYQLVVKFGAHGYLEERYPAVYRHLSRFEKRLKARGQVKATRSRAQNNDRLYPGQHHWLELDNNPSDEYIDLFGKPKLMYPNMTNKSSFYMDYEGLYFTNDKGYIVSSETESLPYLTAVFSSTSFSCSFRDYFPELLGDTREIRKSIFEIIPIRKPLPREARLFEALVPLVQLAKAKGETAPAQFIEDLIDACVMECYFREHMAERDLLFHEALAEPLATYDPDAPGSKQSEVLDHLYRTLNAPDAAIRNRLLRISADSPDLLAVIKEEGRV